MNNFLFLLFLLPAFVSVCNSTTYSGTVFYDDHTFVLRRDVIDQEDGVAFGYFIDEMERTGLTSLYINTSSKYENWIQMYAAGYLEGAMTFTRIYEYYVNFINSNYAYNNNTMPEEIKKFVLTQYDWVKSNAFKKEAERLRGVSADEMEYWKHIFYLINQIEGVVDGYSDHHEPGQELEFINIYMLMMAGDLEDINQLTAPEPHNPLQHLLMRGACSLLMRITEGNEDVFAGHTLWNDYTEMLRVFKHYHFELDDANIVTKSMSFSSKPADLQSKDDFWILSSGLIVTETSLIVRNKTLYDLLTPYTVPAFMRSITASRLSNNLQDWANYYSLYNSGTHNAQYVILDTKRFEVGKSPLSSWTLMLLEDIPGYIEYEDITMLFEKQRYWPGYNLPYFKRVNELTGTAYYEKKYGHWFSYKKAPRARIFARDAIHVNTYEELKAFMQKNDWENDPLSEGYPINAISSRGDLMPVPNPKSLTPGIHGGVDSKITSYSRAKELYSDIISGPTHQQQPVFEWDPKWSNHTHMGLPNRWDFDWQKNPMYYP